MKKIPPAFSTPYFWLIVQALALATLMPKFLIPKLGEDSLEYYELSQQSFLARPIWAGTRTLLYPLFLRGMGWICPSYRILSAVQFAIYTGAVLWLYRSLRRLPMATGPALVAASALFYTNAVFFRGGFHRLYMTDSLALSFALFALGFALQATRNPRCLRYWAGLAASTFAAYQTRPVYLFLIGYLPLLGGWLIFRHRTRPGLSFRFGAVCAAVLIVPYLLFCSWRWSLVSHFGICTFGGENLSGIASQLLDDRLVKKLPPDLQLFAGRVLEKLRTERAQLSDGLWIESWRSPLTGKYTVDSRLLTRQFNFAVIRVTHPLALAFSGQNIQRANQLTLRFSQAVIQRRPVTYLDWVFRNLAGTLPQVWSSPAIRISSALCLGILFAQVWVSLLLTGSGSPPLPTSSRRAIEDVAIVALSFFIAKCLALCLMVPTFSRYAIAAGALLPMIPFALIGATLERWRVGLAANSQTHSQNPEALPWFGSLPTSTERQ